MLAACRMAGPSPLRVLIVDDQPAMARSMARLFADRAEVDTSPSGEEALARIEQGERFDLVLCDVMMPGMTGIDLYERVLTIDAEAARSFVFSTGGVAPELQRRLHATGVRCLAKPCDAAELRALLPAGPSR